MSAAPKLVTVEDVLGLLRAWRDAERNKLYSSARYYQSLLADALDALPSWALPALPPEPAAEVERDLACGAKLTLRNEDGNLIMVVRDHDGEVVAPVLSSAEAEQMRADLARVLAAGRTR